MAKKQIGTATVLILTQAGLDEAADDVATAAMGTIQEELDEVVDGAEVRAVLRAGDLHAGTSLAVGSVIAGPLAVQEVLDRLASPDLVGREELEAAVVWWAEALPEGSIEPIFRLVDRLDLMRRAAGNHIVVEGVSDVGRPAAGGPRL